ncbi:MAG: phosphoribosyl-AMP cyclohydrolase [Chloroflexi bacterium]|jgi:phosphoribosyl-ATP pyrophosphohydrolase/phosphoribosyl-AMP cyclohydrolase|nr:phosphoribosyl-AMP cyclohydrolase [Chloroflexota bacterium]
MSNIAETDDVRFDDRGLIPAVVQDAVDGTVLMLGFMNREALGLTISSGSVWFWSRSRRELWHKGATSGNFLRTVEARFDCDRDAVLVRAIPDGPTCHTGARSCFSESQGTIPAAEEPAPRGGEILGTLFDTIDGRREKPEPGSYTNHLLSQGVDRIGRKIGEEAAEVIIAAKNADPSELTAEVADLFYHAFVLMSAQGVTLDDVGVELRRREGAPRRHKDTGTEQS